METFDTPTMARFEQGVRVITHGTRLRLRLRGELDLVTAPGLLDVVAARLEQCRGHAVTELQIDCADLDFCDSSGLATLILARQRADAAGVRLVLSAQPRHLRHLFQLSGLSALFPAEPESEP
ncbi:STAS domain-containing protein [Actinospica durhamensis]|uniref:Anti-sigma factor antagonist n=1 Tax=Actinospica durhamensis TaxID=1508375 RepID=A0A941EW76_9ACTN|nr:STAS domain-containing protein [Actinospica durhamensis]MBR7837558.1 STAS domain-containing protein [Actinospica durhamensis]